MALSSGTKLGPYEIQSPLGAGGMGEVYRARDTRLDRIVAVKILSTHLSGDPEIKQRFEREARTISSLNHSHICQLYDIGSQDGTDFLVMEFLEGETLAERSARGAVPPQRAIEDRHCRRGSPRSGASRRHRASRPQARQHHVDQVGCKADGFRLGQSASCSGNDAGRNERAAESVHAN
jgi:hypothetical protein